MRLFPVSAILLAAALVFAPSASAQSGPQWTTVQGAHTCVSTSDVAAVGRPVDFRMDCTGMPSGSSWYLAASAAPGLSVLQSNGFAYPIALDNAVVIAQGTVAHQTSWGTTVVVPNTPALIGVEIHTQLVVANGEDFATSMLFSIGPIIQDIIH